MKTILIFAITLLALTCTQALTTSSSPKVYYWDGQWYPVPRPGIFYFYDFNNHFLCPNIYPYKYMQYNCWGEGADPCQCPFPSKLTTVMDYQNYCWDQTALTWNVCDWPIQPAGSAGTDMMVPIDLPLTTIDTIDNPTPDDQGIYRDPTFATDGADSYWPAPNTRYYNWGETNRIGVYWCPYNGGYLMDYCDFGGVGGYCPCIDPPEYAVVQSGNSFTGQGPLVDFTAYPFEWPQGWKRQTYSNAIVFLQSPDPLVTPYPQFTDTFCWDIHRKIIVNAPVPFSGTSVGTASFDINEDFVSATSIILDVSTDAFYWTSQGLYVKFFENAIVYYRESNTFDKVVSYNLVTACWDSATTGWTVMTHTPTDSSTGNQSPDSSTGTSPTDSSTGNQSPDSSTGNQSPDSSTGNQSPDSSTGNQSPDSSTGNQSPDSSTGNQSPDSSTGNPSTDSSTGTPSTDSSTGTPSTDSSDSSTSQGPSVYSSSTGQSGGINSATIGTPSFMIIIATMFAIAFMC
jgi:hypothetical protein